MKKEWKIEESDYGDEYWFGGPGKGCIEVGGWVNGGVKDDPVEWGKLQVEARIISAATDLLAALQMIVQLSPELPMGCIEDAEAAISKATGA